MVFKTFLTQEELAEYNKRHMISELIQTVTELSGKPYDLVKQLIYTWIGMLSLKQQSLIDYIYIRGNSIMDARRYLRIEFYDIKRTLKSAINRLVTMASRA